MRIVGSDIALWANRQARTETEREERLLTWVGDRPTEPGRGNTGDANASATAQAAGRMALASLQVRQVSVSAEAQTDAHAQQITESLSDVSTDELQHETQGVQDQELNDLILMLRTLGDEHAEKRIQSIMRARSEIESAANGKTVEVAQEQPSGDAAPTTDDGPERVGWGLEYDLVETRTEHERTDFSARGKVQTADGHNIELALDQIMERATVHRREVHIREGDAQPVDPLVISAPGEQVAFSGHHRFDIDADGTVDTVAQLRSGHYLTMDHNGNGMVDDGSELFGPQSGNGFAELAAHDQDNNGWIDEADAAYTQLGVWRPGAQDIRSLSEANVGALYLANVATPFAVHADAGTGPQQAQVQSSSIYLTEDGAAGTVQHVDLIKRG